MATKRSCVYRNVTSALLRIRLSIGKKIYGYRLGQPVVRVSTNRVIKGPCEKTELAALRFVADHTSIPVPKVFKAHDYHGRLFVEMEYIHGMPLDAAWLGGYLSQDQKTHIVQEVADYVNQLRILKPPQEGIVASASLEACFDHRVGPCAFGPFSSHEEFHNYLRVNLPIEDCTQVYGAEVTDLHSRQYRSCFSHADLCPRNIIVDNGKVAALIDWESGGWYPEYWEYTKACFGMLGMVDWYAEFKSAMTNKYDDELRAERSLWNQCDQPGMCW